MTDHLQSREQMLLDICTHLGAAVVQSIPSDDQIIMDHVRSAYQIAKDLRITERSKTGEGS